VCINDPISFGRKLKSILFYKSNEYTAALGPINNPAQQTSLAQTITDG